MLDLGLPGAKGLSQGYLRVGRRRGEGLASVSLKQIRVRVSGPHTTPLLQEPKTRGTAPLAHMLFTTHYVPAPSAPTNTETQLLYCHRLGIPLPFIAPPLRHHCCRNVGQQAELCNAQVKNKTTKRPTPRFCRTSR